MYFLTCACVDFAAAALACLPHMQRVTVCALHGRMKQAAREATLTAFTDLKAGECNTRPFVLARACSRLGSSLL